MSLNTITIFFIITALGGAVLLTFVLKDKNRPMYIVAIHGLMALTSFALLLYFSGSEVGGVQMGNIKGVPNNSIVLFSIAIIGGVYMFVRDKIMKKGIQKWMPFVHASAALLGIIFLFIYAGK
ncbi:MAG TPA: hypothetical protein VF691_06635 [Cytophagaceae bacterium]|jgi:hypothetical protein